MKILNLHKNYFVFSSRMKGAAVLVILSLVVFSLISAHQENEVSFLLCRVEYLRSTVNVYYEYMYVLYVYGYKVMYSLAIKIRPVP
jgi:hypothetical protein